MCHITHYEYSMLAIGLGMGVIGMYLSWYMQWLGYSRHRDIPVNDIWDWQHEPPTERTFRREICEVITDGGKWESPPIFRARFRGGKCIESSVMPSCADGTVHRGIH